MISCDPAHAFTADEDDDAASLVELLEKRGLPKSLVPS